MGGKKRSAGFLKELKYPSSKATTTTVKKREGCTLLLFLHQLHFGCFSPHAPIAFQNTLNKISSKTMLQYFEDSYKRGGGAIKKFFGIIFSSSSPNEDILSWRLPWPAPLGGS